MPQSDQEKIAVLEAENARLEAILQDVPVTISSPSSHPAYKAVLADRDEALAERDALAALVAEKDTALDVAIPHFEAYMMCVPSKGDIQTLQACTTARAKSHRSVERARLVAAVVEAAKRLSEGGPYTDGEGQCSFCDFVENDSEDMDHMIAHSEKCDWRFSQEALARLAAHDAKNKKTK